MSESNSDPIQTQFTPVTHVIFDLDGTLIDSEKYFFLSVSDILQQYNHKYDRDLRAKTVGMFIANSAPIIVEHCQLPLTPEQYIEKVLVRFQAYIAGQIESAEKIMLLPGVQRLLDHLRVNRIPMAICTASMKETYDKKIIPFPELFSPGNQYFHHVVIGSIDPEVKQNKPSPDAYRVCIKRFNDVPDDDILRPEQVLAFEDSPTGLHSALDAGCQCVFIPESTFDCSRLTRKPTLILPSMENFRPEQFGLPPFFEN